MQSGVEEDMRACRSHHRWLFKRLEAVERIREIDVLGCLEWSCVGVFWHDGVGLDVCKDDTCRGFWTLGPHFLCYH